MKKIYSRLEDESDRENILNMLQENLIHAGDKLINNKIIELIKKGFAVVVSPNVSEQFATTTSHYSGSHQPMGDP